MVVGPTVDGGYYLLALASEQSVIFDGIPWSTDRVLTATKARARDMGFSLAELPVLSDIDTVDDLFPDGTQTVTVTVSGPAVISDSQTFDVTDNGDTFSLVYQSRENVSCWQREHCLFCVKTQLDL